jgi:hypothetical protein
MPSRGSEDLISSFYKLEIRSDPNDGSEPGLGSEDALSGERRTAVCDVPTFEGTIILLVDTFCGWRGWRDA